MATAAGRTKEKARSMRPIVIGALTVGVLLLVVTVALQLRSSFVTHERSIKRDAPPPTLLTTIKPAASVPVLRAAAARAPNDAAAWSRLGDATLAQSDLPAAIDAYKQAVALDDRRWQDWSALGEAYVQTAQSNGARLPPPAHDAFAHALRLNPNDMRSLFYVAMERDFLGQHDAAIDSWMTMLAQVPIGSKADGAIRGAIIASVARHAISVRERMKAATAAQAAVKAAS